MLQTHLKYLAFAFGFVLTGSLAAIAQQRDLGTRLLEEDRDRRQLEALANNRAGQLITVPDIEGPVEEALCFPIDEISLTGVTIFDPASFDPILDMFRGKCLGQTSINNLINGISATYADRGFITTRAYVPGQDIASRALTIEVLEGKIEAYVYQQVDEDDTQKPGPPRKLKSALPIQAGDVFQLRDLEHGLEQMNRLRSTKADANLAAGQTPGTSVVQITERKSDPIRGTLGINNRGSSVTGKTQISFNLEAGDLLRINDIWSLSYTGSENTNALTFNVSAPYRRWLFSLSGSYSEDLTPVANFTDLLSQTANLNLGIDRLLHRNARSKYTIYANAKSYWNERFVNISELTPQHRSALQFGLRQEHRTEKSVIFADVALTSGAGFLGSDRDPENLTAGTPSVDFRKLEARATYIRPFEAGPQLSLSFTGQISDGPLFSNEQISIGSWETVRGYSGFSFSGENGFYLRSELSFSSKPIDIRSWGKDFEEKDQWNPFENATGGFRPFVFLDAGYVEARGTTDTATMLGTGVGFSAQLWHGTLNGGLAVPLKDQNGQRAGEYQAFLGVTFKIF